MKPTHTLREEHDCLMQKIQFFEEILDSLAFLPHEDLERVVREQVVMLQEEIKAHAAAEEKYLYTEVDYLCGLGRGTGVKPSTSMQIDHEYIGAYIDRLSEMARTIRSENLAAFQRTGWELAAILKLHFDKEERVFLSLLDERFTEEEVEQKIVRRMEQYVKGNVPAPPSERKLILLNKRKTLTGAQKTGIERIRK